ncbi:Putative competence-damage inducible protein [Paraburkholderia fynbosensis]|uniref:Competence-damage inducible protein n=1 Tax=Paraburkholderia fynbosensis TaxID=1200993 RepID=A0A6J5GLB4_9BURK|nr:Putative competence-damage inducible protein [Paraburkholderia fynbosensis]
MYRRTGPCCCPRVAGSLPETTHEYSYANVSFLTSPGLKLATAESCTGGQISSWLASVPGSGACLDVGFVSYSPLGKTGFLGVKEAGQEQHIETAAAMRVFCWWFRSSSTPRYRAQGVPFFRQFHADRHCGHRADYRWPGHTCFRPWRADQMAIRYASRLPSRAYRRDSRSVAVYCGTKPVRLIFGARWNGGSFRHGKLPRGPDDAAIVSHYRFSFSARSSPLRFVRSHEKERQRMPGSA